jgi:predicted PurR-regulated permease PerM
MRYIARGLGMKLPWNRKYLVVCFHVVATFGAIYLLKLLLDGAAHIAVSLPDFGNGVKKVLSWIVGLFSPLVIALVVAYLLDPAVDRLQKFYEWGIEGKIKAVRARLRLKGKPKPEFKSRAPGTALAYLLLVAILGFTIVWIATRLNIQKDFSASLIAAAQNSLSQFTTAYADLKARLDEIDALSFASKYLQQIFDSIETFTKGFFSGIISNLSNAGGSIVDFALGMILAFYLSSGKYSLLHGVKSVARVFVPSKPRKRISRLAIDIDHVLTGYIRGMLIDVMIVAVMISLYLSLIHVQFAVLLGAITGLANIVPYFGAFFGLLLSSLVALLSGDPWKALQTAIGILVLQQIDGMIINPRIVANSVEINPILVILALSIGGSLFGITGMILAVPVCAILKNFALRFFKAKREEKALDELSNSSGKA